MRNYFLGVVSFFFVTAVLEGLSFSAPLPFLVKPRDFLPAAVNPLYALPFLAARLLSDLSAFICG